ncbi:THO complex subunit 6-like protein [Trichoplax sp. H2]|nr:THO complex subunit 6-like protein [Trichoplax sp. H2]|eukprot:RDD37182.1 THO complex subunit 6-like protein [Trichoplax sp. H2]
MDKYEKAILAERMDMYGVVYSLCYSPCGKLLAAGDNFGRIFIFQLESALNSTVLAKEKEIIKRIIQVHSGPIYALTSTSTYLVCGILDRIVGYKWSEILDKDIHEVWKIYIPSSKQYKSAQVNSLVWNEEENILYCGCGDGRIYGYDLKSGHNKCSMVGHEDSIHSIVLDPQSKACISSSEDGSVRFWDNRKPSQIAIIEPYKHQQLSHHGGGKWISAMATDADGNWMACGGATGLSIWHLQSRTLTSSCNDITACVRDVVFYDGNFITVGDNHHVTHTTINGEVTATIPTSSSPNFAIQINENLNSKPVLCTAGNSIMIDIFINFFYKTTSFQCTCSY